MHLNALLSREGCKLDTCPPVQCPGSCNLKTESCSIVAQSCPSTCARIRCDPLPSKSSGGSGPSPGALAGAVIGALIILGLVVLGYMYYRRREAAKELAAKEKALADVKPDIPARADAVLSRPDPHFAARASASNNNEKPAGLQRAGSADATELGTVRVYKNHSDTTINLDPSQSVRRQSGSQSVRSNPFADGASIQTASDRSQSTNVIPIALVPPSGHIPDSQTHSSTPLRPGRSPDLTLNDGHTDLEHVAVSDTELDPARLPYESSTRSGISGRSFMSTSSTATDLDEAPMIMTPTQGVVRQVFGVSQAQVVRVPSNASAASKLRGPRANQSAKNAAARASKAALGRSPLAQQSFTSADIPLASRELSTSPSEDTGNPFSDEATPQRASFADSSRSADTFASHAEYHSEGPFTRRPGATFPDVQSSRPVSTASTVDGMSIRADIGTASRVMLGMQSPTYTASNPLSPIPQSRTTSMQTNGGRTVVSVDRDDDDESVRPHSILSAKTTSSRADSVLAGFPFVPPSPISALPPRSPGAQSPGNSPASAGSMFARQQAMNHVKSGSSGSPTSPTSTIVTQTTVTPGQFQRHPPPPVPRSNHSSQAPKERGISTFSTSTSSGLETYPFQFGESSEMSHPSLPRTNRASLDTLALSRALAQFPLEYEGLNYPDGQNQGK